TAGAGTGQLPAARRIASCCRKPPIRFEQHGAARPAPSMNTHKENVMATLLGERSARASWRDYLELTKPRVVLLMLITSLVGMFLATRAGVPWTVLLFGNLGIALCAGGAAA